MSTISFPAAGLSVPLPLTRFSSEEYLAMVDTGLLDGKRVELIAGVIVDMSPAGIPHNFFLMRLNRLFAPLWDRAIVSIQGTLPVAGGQVFDPDFMLLRNVPDGYKTALPQPQDVLLVIEAAESSLKRDQQFKLPVYATAGIPEYWIADLDHEQIFVYRSPVGATYQSVQTLKGNDRISPIVAPEFSVSIQQMFE